MGMLLLGLGGFGVENFTSSGADIGKVGSITISSDDYARGLRSEMQGFAAQTGRNLTKEEAQSVGLPQMVLSRLVLSASLEDEAKRLGISVGDKTVADQLVDAGAFKGLNGQFDPAIYADVLRREGLTVREFENDLRMDAARMILQRAAVSGVKAPDVVSNLSASWMLETRNVAWQELVAADLSAPIVAPDQATLEAWHQANADRFTKPEARKISYVWLTPEMIEDKVQIDDQALRDLYQERIDEFQKPERRMVERLVFQNEAEAEAAKARLDKGEIGFEALANERGLNLSDIDLGEVTKAELGAAGDAVFAPEQPGVVGPVKIDLGAALYSMNAILEPQDIPFEQAKSELRGEAALDRARRQIDDLRSQVDDLIAGGASLEDVAKDTELEFGQIEWTDKDQPQHGSIAAYPDFRTYALNLTPEDFPELHDLDDGGIFALRLDEIVPPSLIPFAEVSDRVRDDWIASETHRQLLALGAERKLAAMAETMSKQDAAAQEAATDGATPATEPAADADATAAPVTPEAGNGAVAGTDASGATVPVPAAEWHVVPDLARDGFIEGTPQALVTGAFDLKEVGDADVVTAENRVFLVRLDAINKADLKSDRAQQVLGGVQGRLGDAMKQDFFDYYARAVQAAQGITINQAAIDAVNARM